jgi:putative redox protein
MARMATTYAVVPFAVHAEGTGVQQDITVQGDNQHAVRADTYPAFGGEDSAPSPLAYALAALSSCNQVVAQAVAQGLGVTLGKLTFDVQGDLDTAVIAGGEEGNANFDRVTVKATIESDASPEQFEQLKSETERRCPVSQLFIRSGLEYDAQWTQAPLS